ncbi:MAG TPA: DUF1345 domain-containing protein [Streptosporangiaceae bacterium]|nr:DUF1345 domain-containing protein [Streptosporangiaceae bacterium]
MAIGRAAAPREQSPPTMRRVVVALVAGTAAGVLAALLGDWRYALAIGWDAAAIVFTSWVWLAIWPLSAPGTASHATAEDPSRAISDTIMLSACVASLAAVGMVLVYAHSSPRPAQVLLATLSLISLAVSWLTVHTIYTLRYARLYYRQTPGGIDFNSSDPPRYQDFAYLALTLGMTYQVSDTSLRSTDMRAAALKHALLSYLFGAVILAAAINLVSGLGSSGLFSG